MISPPKSLDQCRRSSGPPGTQVAHLEVFGGYGGSSHTGQWTEPPGCLWRLLFAPWVAAAGRASVTRSQRMSRLFLINLGRCCDYSYRFEFSED